MIENIKSILLEAGDKLMNFDRIQGSKGYWEGSQYHANADKEINSFIFSKLSHFKSYPIVSEENQFPSNITNDKFWLIDPIDGTASYAHGYDGYVIQIALMENFTPILSAVYAPERNDLYFAIKGEGSFLNNKKIRCIESDKLVLIDNYSKPFGAAKQVYENIDIYEYIECGSIGLKICKVAEGCANIFVKDVTVRDWDLAAPILILEESQGIISTYENKKINFTGNSTHIGIIACSSIAIHNKVVSIIN